MNHCTYGKFSFVDYFDEYKVSDSIINIYRAILTKNLGSHEYAQAEMVYRDRASMITEGALP